MIPVNTPSFSGNESDYLKECIETGWVSSEGPFVGRFEQSFAETVGRQYGVAVCNGTAALEAAVSALDIGAGDEVILPTFTIISCALAVLRAGATPVVVDCDPLTWNMVPELIEAKITKRTRAIMAVHIYGLPVDMTAILALAEKHGLAVIEDAAEVIGQTCRGKPCGSFGHLSVFSFYPNKHVTTGEGGMVVTDDPELAERCRAVRNLCFQSGRRFVHKDLGANFRMSNLQAAVGLAQLERLDKTVRRKREMGLLYNQLLQEIGSLQLPVPRTAEAENIYWVYGVVLDDRLSLSSDEVMQSLVTAGIGTRPFFWPMHEQPVLRKMGFFEGECCPVAEKIARRGFYLPSGLGLLDEEIETVAKALKRVLS